MPHYPAKLLGASAILLLAVVVLASTAVTPLGVYAGPVVAQGTPGAAGDRPLSPGGAAPAPARQTATPRSDVPSATSTVRVTSTVAATSTRESAAPKDMTPTPRSTVGADVVIPAATATGTATPSSGAQGSLTSEAGRLCPPTCPGEEARRVTIWPPEESLACPDNCLVFNNLLFTGRERNTGRTAESYRLPDTGNINLYVLDSVDWQRLISDRGTFARERNQDGGQTLRGTSVPGCCPDENGEGDIGHPYFKFEYLPQETHCLEPVEEVDTQLRCLDLLVLIADPNLVALPVGTSDLAVGGGFALMSRNGTVVSARAGANRNAEVSAFLPCSRQPTAGVRLQCR